MEKFKQEAVWTVRAEWGLGSVNSGPGSAKAGNALSTIHISYVALCLFEPQFPYWSHVHGDPTMAPEQLLYWAVLSPIILVPLRADRQHSRPQEAEQ